MAEKRFLGFVVQFANDPQYKGTNAYLLANWEHSTAGLCYSLETATIFGQREQAQSWAEKHATLRTTSTGLPEVVPVWEETKRTLTGTEPAISIPFAPLSETLFIGDTRLVRCLPASQNKVP